MPRLHRLPGHTQRFGKAARVPDEIEYGTSWSEVAQAAMQQSTRSRGRAGSEIQFLDDQGAISSGRELLHGAGTIDAATDDGDVEDRILERRQGHAHWR